MNRRLKRYISLLRMNNTMKIIYTIALSEIKSLFREKVVYSITGVFIFMALISTFISWSTFSTVNSVYSASVAFIQNQGITDIPANPFHLIPALASFDNLIIYIILIGALMGIIIGHRSIIRERKSGILQILFTRPITKKQIILGKILGLSIVLAGVVSLTALVSIVSAKFLPIQSLTFSDHIHLVFFFLLSFLYILFFTLVGFLFSIITKSESLALFIPLLIWVGLTFILPELATGLSPTALLNPVTLLNIPPAEGLFQHIQSIISPISLGSHYTTISGELLGSSFVSSHAISQILKDHGLKIILLLFGIVLLPFLSFKYLEKFNPQADNINE